MTLTAVTISSKPETFLDGIHFYCHTEGYVPMTGHDNKSRERITYITNRYNTAVEEALRRFPDTTRIMICDTYYLHQAATEMFLRKYQDRHFGHGHIGQGVKEDDFIIGCSIWFYWKHNVWNNYRYYETLSVREFRGKAWHSKNQLPTGTIRVGCVGACWIFPRAIWNSGFRYDWTGESLVNSDSLDTDGRKIWLDCDTKLWRSHENNPQITDYKWPKRIRVSAGALRRKIMAGAGFP